MKSEHKTWIIIVFLVVVGMFEFFKLIVGMVTTCP